METAAQTPLLDPVQQQEFARQMAARNALRPVGASSTPAPTPQDPNAIARVGTPQQSAMPPVAPVAPQPSAEAARQAARHGGTPVETQQAAQQAAKTTPPPQAPAPVAKPVQQAAPAAPAAPIAPPQSPEDRAVAAAQAKVDETNKPHGIAHLIPMTPMPQAHVDENGNTVQPSFLSKFGHGALRAVEGAGRVAGTIAETAGNIAVPGVMMNIPGSQMHNYLEQNLAQGHLAQAEKNRHEAADTSKWAEVSGGAVDPAHPELGQQQAFYDKSNPTNRTYAGAMKPDKDKAPLESGEIQNANAGFLDRFKVLNPDAKELPPQYTLPPHATKEQRDFVDKQLEQVEKSTGTAAQNATTEKMRKDAAVEHEREFNQKEDEKLVNYVDPETGDLVSGTKGEANAAHAKIKGPTNMGLQEKAKQAYVQYGRIIDNAQAAGNTMPAWNNEADRQAAMKVSKVYWEHVGGSVGIAGAGVNPEYLQQAINSDAYRSMTPEGREHMQNMFQLWSDAINIVKQETGGVPKGAQFLQKEDAILPHPDKTADMNEKALANLVKRIRTDSKEYARPSENDRLGGYVPVSAQGELHDSKGHIVGYRDSKGKDVIW